MGFLMTGDRNPFYGKKHDKKTLEKMSIKSKKAWENDSFRNEQIERNKKTNCGSGNPFYGKKHTEQAKKRMSDSKSKLISSGKLRCGPRGFKGYHISKIGKLEMYDSSYELLYMKFLDDDPNIKCWTKTHNIVISIMWNNKPRKYIPDFLVVDSNEQISIRETKGYENQEKLAAKIEYAKKFCVLKDVTYIFVDANEINQICKRKYGFGITEFRKRNCEK